MDPKRGDPDAFVRYLRNPPKDSAARRAMEFGIDLSLTFSNMFGRSMADRLARLDERLGAGSRPRPARRLGPIPR